MAEGYADDREESFDRLQDIIEAAGQLERRADFSKLVDNSYAKEIYESLF